MTLVKVLVSVCARVARARVCCTCRLTPRAAQVHKDNKVVQELPIAALKKVPPAVVGCDWR